MHTPAMERRLILIVDDEEINRQLFSAMVKSLGHDSESAVDGKDALKKIGSHIDLVLMDVMMPGMDGFDTTRAIRENPETHDIPIIMITALTEKPDRLKAVEAGANDFISKPVDKLELKVRSTSLLNMKSARDALKNYNSRLEEEVVRRTADLRAALKKVTQANLDTIQRLVIASQRKDDDTGSHIVRMSNYSALMAEAYGLSEVRVQIMKVASTMHDIGKIGTPDSVLLKPGKLNAREWEIMKQHTVIGADILRGSSSEYLQMGEVIALTHHEQWDGKGYPHGLKGEEIPLEGRLSAVADRFDALTTDRPYRKALPNDKALEIIHGWKGSHFEPQMVDLFFENIDGILKIQSEFSGR